MGRLERFIDEDNQLKDLKNTQSQEKEVEVEKPKKSLSDDFMKTDNVPETVSHISQNFEISEAITEPWNCKKFSAQLITISSVKKN